MHLERYKKRKRNWRRVGAGFVVVLALIAAYVAYWIFTPTQLTVTSMAPSSTNPSILILTIRNPTFKFLNGELTTVRSDIQIPNPSDPSRPRILNSLDRIYQLSFSPLSSQTLSIPMDANLVPNHEYDIFIHLDYIGDQTIPAILPQG